METNAKNASEKRNSKPLNCLQHIQQIVLPYILHPRISRPRSVRDFILPLGDIYEANIFHPLTNPPSNIERLSNPLRSLKAKLTPFVNRVILGN